MIVDVFGPGAVVDGFRVEALAGRGGSSVVYRAVEVASGDPVALKVLPTPDHSARRRLAREARLLAGVRHPGIVPFRGLLEVESHDVLVTDWIEGVPLLRRRDFGDGAAVDRTLALLWDLADALDHLHGLDIVHRDITPANIIIRPDGSPTLIDLGIGHHIDSATMTNDDLLAGTPRYLAPEVIRGEPATGRSDQYGVGVLLHEMLTGRSPFPDAAQVATALHHQLHTEPEPLDEIDPNIPSGLADAVLRSLDKDPDRRFPSMGHFARAATARTADSGGRWYRRAIGPAAVAAVVVVGGLAVSQTLLSSDSPGPATSDTAPSDTASSIGGTAADNTGIEGDAVESGSSDALDEPLVIDIDEPPEGKADGGDVQDRSDWPAGTAETVACNLLQGSTFGDGGLPLDYFGEPAGRERVVAEAGYNSTAGLEVGQAGAFGQFGEIVPVQPGEQYRFTGWVRTVGDVAEAEVGISFLTTDYGPLSTGDQAPITNGDGAFFELNAVAPEGAGFAVPYLFKDSSTGVVVADELLFGRADLCRAEVTVPAP